VSVVLDRRLLKLTLFAKARLFLISLILFARIAVFSTTPNIRDLTPASKEYKAVSFLVEKKIMEVDQNQNFKPSLLITRLDLAKYLYNLITTYDFETLCSKTASDVSKDIEKLQRQINNLEKEVQEIQRFLQTAEISRLSSELNDLKKRVANLEGRVNTRLEQVDKKLAELDTKLKLIESRVSQLTTTATAITQPSQHGQPTHTALAELQNTVKSLDSTVKSLSESSKRIDDTLKGQSTELANLRSKLASVEGSVQQISKSLSDFDKRLGSLHDAIVGDRRTFTAQLDSLRMDVSKLSEQQQENSKFFQNLTEELKETKQKISSVESTIAKEINAQVVELSKTLVNLDERVGKLEKVINTGEEFINRLETLDPLTLVNFAGNLQLITNRVEQLETRAQKNEEAVRVINADLKQLTSQIADTKSVQRQLEDTITKLETSIEKQSELERMLKESEKRVQSLRNELEIYKWLSVAAITVSVLFALLFVLGAQ